MSLILKAIDTVEVRVEVAIPPENPQIRGFLLCDAVIRSKEDMRKLQEQLEAGDFDGDADILVNAPAPLDKDGKSIGDKGLFKDIRGLVNTEGKSLESYDEALREVTEGRYSVYLTSALVRKYFAHMQEAPAKNSKRSRGR